MFFNYDNIWKQAKYNPIKFMALFENYFRGKIFDQRIKNKFIGSSYLLEPEPLIIDRDVDVLYKVQYINLAARRSYSHYKMYGFKGVDLSLFPDINIEAIISNKLLKINNNTITFKYE